MLVLMHKALFWPQGETIAVGSEIQTISEKKNPIWAAFRRVARQLSICIRHLLRLGLAISYVILSLFHVFFSLFVWFTAHTGCEKQKHNYYPHREISCVRQ